MTDIVERLRVAAPLPTGLYCEAADVIDALRQQLFEEHEAHLIAEQKWIEKLATETNNKQQFERDWLECCDKLFESQAREKSWKRRCEYFESVTTGYIHERVDKLAPKPKADDLFAMRLLAESQAREKVLRDELFELANLHVVVYSQSPEGRAYMKKLGDLMASTDDTALQDLILKERTRAVDTYKHLQQELVLKAALAAERERIAKHFDGKGEMFGDTVADAIRALGDE